jgi:hypothetical protein
MEWYYIRVTDGNQQDRVDAIISSIRLQPMHYLEDAAEIIVIGGKENKYNLWKNDTFIPFDEKREPAAIAKKKNIVFKAAKYQNISVGHDYVAYGHRFFEGFKSFLDWDVCMTRILTRHGQRYRDWVLYDDDKEQSQNPHAIRWVDYNDLSRTRRMYVSGAFYCIKKDFALKYPLEDWRQWSQSEDVAWSLAVRDKWNYKINQLVNVNLLKEKDIWPPYSKGWNWQ